MRVGNELQGLHRGRGDGALAEQWNHMRKDRRMNRITRIEHTSNALRVARLQCHDLQHVGVGTAEIRSCGLLLHDPPIACRVRVASASSRV